MSRPAAPLRERILQTIKIDENGCWRWQLAPDKDGYGRITVQIDGKGKQRPAHRISYIAFRGEIAPGLEPDHTCRVRDCVNPWHLEPVTHAENIRRSPLVGIHSGRHNAVKTHCPRGHEYNAENTRFRPGKGRDCRRCHSEHARASAERRRAA